MIKVPFYIHDLGQAELDAVADALRDPILTTGQTVEKFETRFAEYLECRHALAVTSCTGAMHMSLLALGIGPGDEVITTPMSFVATACAILEARATPVFVDVEADTGNLDAAKVEAAITPATKAIMPVHLYGQMCDMRALRRIADDHDLHLIEDSAHCVEGARDGVRPGQLSDVACFSFYATKNLTCGEGGALVTDDEGLYGRLVPLRLHGITKDSYHRHPDRYQHYDMHSLGWKYNMSNIEAALLLAQFDRLEAKLAKRGELARYYLERLSGIDGITLPATRPGVVHARHVFPVWVKSIDQDEAIRGLEERGIQVVVNYHPIHLMQFFRETLGHKPGDFPVAEGIGHATISLPFYPDMPFEHVDRVAEALQSVLATN